MKPPRSSARQRSHDTPRSPRPWLSSRGRFQTPRCDGSTPSRTSSTGTSCPSRATGCAPPCREGGAPYAAGACRRVLFDGGGRDQVHQLQRVAACGGTGARGHGGDPRADSRSAQPLELARGAGGRALRGRGAAVRVREQADHGGKHCIPAGDEPAVRGRARAVVVARARARGGPRVHGCPGRRPGAAVRRRAAALRDRARVPALEASLFLLVEPVLSPVWAWLAHGETPGPLAVVGGAVILMATALKAWTDNQMVAA